MCNNAYEEFYHEPYMQHFRDDFSQVSSESSVDIELPWKDIALNAADFAKIESSKETEEVSIIMLS